MVTVFTYGSVCVIVNLVCRGYCFYLRYCPCHGLSLGLLSRGFFSSMMLSVLSFISGDQSDGNSIISVMIYLLVSES